MYSSRSAPIADDAPASRAGFDPISMAVFSNRLLSITEDMGNTLIRSSVSTNIKERRDCSVALFDASGRLIAQATHIPLHLGSLSGAVRVLLESRTLDSIEPGDVYISNDAYLAGGSHAPDITLVTPVFYEGRIRFFAANTGHHSDVGGAVPGSTAPHLTSVWEEGLRLPMMRIARGGELDAELLTMIAENTREPTHREHDLRAQIATNEHGARLLREMIGVTGLEEVLSSIEDVLLYTERRLRHVISALPETRASFTEWMDDDGLGGDPVPITAHVEARTGQLNVDFTGSGRQSRGSFNIPENALKASVYFAVKTMLDPGLPANEGMFAPITVTSPPRTITSPVFPAAVGARATTAQRVAGAVVGSLVQLLPENKAMASANDVMPAMLFAGPTRRSGDLFVYLETIGGGAGGRAQGDGMDGIQIHVTNTSNLPAEALELEYPLLVEEYGLVCDSGGAGRYRGGLGIARQIRSLVDGMNCSARCDGALIGAGGLNSGRAGGLARLIWNPGRPDEKPLPAKVSGLVLKAGQAIRLETPGGGGYGNPCEREPGSLSLDLLRDKISSEAAERDYGSGVEGDLPLCRAQSQTSKA